MLAEEVLAQREHRADLLYRAGRPFPVGAARDTADVRQTRQRVETAADEIEAVDTDLARGVGERQGEDERAQQRCLARLGPADHRRVAARRREVQEPLPLPLLGRVVEQSDGNAERPPAPFRDRPGQPHAARSDVQRAG